MLQSAFFSDLQPSGIIARVGGFLPQRAAKKGSFARLAGWGRSLFVRNDLQGLSGHLLRDIGVQDHD